MIIYKSQAEIDLMREAGMILAGLSFKVDRGYEHRERHVTGRLQVIAELTQSRSPIQVPGAPYCNT